MSSQQSPAPLLPRVREILQRIGDSAHRESLERFFNAAAVAIQQLSELEQTTGEHELKSGGERLWHVVEPHFRATLAHVQSFLNVVHQEFPHTDSDGELGVDRALFEEEDLANSNADVVATPSEEVAAILSAIRINMLRDLTAIESTLSALAIAEDRWNLLETLGEFRGKSRAAVGEAVFLVCRLYAVVRKGDVIPFFNQDLQAALLLRRGVASFRRTMRGDLETLCADATWSEPTHAQPAIAALGSHLDALMVSDTYELMRPADQRSFFETRRDLAAMGDALETHAQTLQHTIEGFARFLDSLVVINRREVLVLHDGETATRALAMTAELVAQDGENAPQTDTLLELLEALRGRNDALDDATDRLQEACALAPDQRVTRLQAVEALLQGRVVST